jgi:hypothetical protein
MYLFTRTGRLAPDAIREGMTQVATITERVRQEAGLEVHTWAATMSPELGAVVWATFVNSLEELESAGDKLTASESFVELVEAGADLFEGPMRDGLAQVVSGLPVPAAPLPNYVAVVRATAANGRFSEAMAAGVEIAETATRITGTPTSFLVDVTGLYGGVRWNSAFPDIASLERGEAALMADESWMAMIDRLGTSFEAGATQSMFRRMT